jgi:DNA invertase Pin-like site-specific DNA recombinase
MHSAIGKLVRSYIPGARRATGIAIARQQDADRPIVPDTGGSIPITTRQAEVLLLAAGGLCRKQIARHLGISSRTVQSHFSGMRQRTGTRSDAELMANAVMAGLVRSDSITAPQAGWEESPSCHPVPETAISGTPSAGGGRPGQPVPETSPGTACRNAAIGTVSGTIGSMTTAPAYTNTVRIGYARVSGRTQDHQLQLDALDEADCREVIVETASTRSERPKLRATLHRLKPGDTLVIYKPDRIARSMKELLVLLEDELHAREINLHILTGICGGLHRPKGQTIADKMLFMVAAMAAEMERDLISERTLDGLAAAAAQGRRGGRPTAVDHDTLAIARARQARGESVTDIAKHLKIGRSTLYRALRPNPAI